MSYIDRGAWLARGSGMARLNQPVCCALRCSTTDDDGTSPGSFKTVPFALPACTASSQVLQLNIFTAIGARAELLSADGATVFARSVLIEGGGVHHNVSWLVKKPGAPLKVWRDASCAYEAPPPIDSCGAGQGYQNCTVRHDCKVYDGIDPAAALRRGTCTCRAAHARALQGRARRVHQGHLYHRGTGRRGVWPQSWESSQNGRRRKRI
jgi:hypothetical protein